MKTILRSRVRHAAAASLLAMCVNAVGLAEQLTIADIAPQDSILVASVPNMSQMTAAFNRTGFREIWDSPEIQKWIRRHSEEMIGNLVSALDEVGLEKEDLKPPTGAFGVAVWMNSASFMEMQNNPPGMLMLAEYDDAEAMQATIMQVVDHAVERQQIELEEEAYGDITIYSLTTLEPEEEEDAMGEDEWDWEDEPSPFEIKTFHMARSGNHMLLSNDMDRMEAAIDRIGGKEVTNVTSSRNFQSALTQQGDAQAYVVFLTAPLFRALDGMAAEAPEGAMAMRMVDGLGLTELRAASAGMRFDADEGMLVTSYGMLVPEKRGLFELANQPGISIEPPAFISADAASLTMFRFDFKGVLPLVEKIIAGLPDQQRQQAEMFYGQLSMTAQPILDSLGPDVYISQTFKRPFTSDSQQQLFVLKTSNEQAIGQTLAGFAPMMGLQSRDFQGAQIWSPQQGMGPVPAPSLALGAGHLFVGPKQQVEDALRQASQPDAPRLSDDPAFRAAARVPQAGAIGYSYTNTRRLVEWGRWYFDNFDKIIAAQYEQMLGDDQDEDFREWVNEQIEAAKEARPEWMNDIPDFKIIPEHVGDSISEFYPTDEGFVGRTIWLRPQ